MSDVTTELRAIRVCARIGGSLGASTKGGVKSHKRPSVPTVPLPAHVTKARKAWTDDDRIRAWVEATMTRLALCGDSTARKWRDQAETTTDEDAALCECIMLAAREETPWKR